MYKNQTIAIADVVTITQDLLHQSKKDRIDDFLFKPDFEKATIS